MSTERSRAAQHEATRGSPPHQPVGRRAQDGGAGARAGHRRAEPGEDLDRAGAPSAARAHEARGGGGRPRPPTSPSSGSCASSVEPSRCCVRCGLGPRRRRATQGGADARLDELVFKLRDGAGGEGIVLGAQASSQQLSRLRVEIDADPGAWIGQEPVALSTHPTVVDGRLEPRHVDLRPFVVGGRVLPGGLSRFARGAGRARRQLRAGRWRQGRVGAAGLAARLRVEDAGHDDRIDGIYERSADGALVWPAGSEDASSCTGGVVVGVPQLGLAVGDPQPACGEPCPGGGGR